MYSSFNARAVGLPDLSTETTIDVAAAAGFDAVDLMIRDIVRSGADLTAIQRRMVGRNLQAGAFPMPFEWRGDEASFHRDLAELPSLARAAATLGFTRTGTWVMPETPTMPPPQRDLAAFRAEVTRFHVDRIRPVARILADYGIRLGLEVIGVATFRRGLGVPFVTRLEDLGPTLVELATEPNIGLLVDAFHLHAADEPFSTALTWGADRIVWAHVADLPRGPAIDRAAIIDAERGLPGSQNAVACGEFLALLSRSGYDGPVTVEPLSRCSDLVGQEPAEVALRVKRSLDTCWPVG